MDAAGQQVTDRAIDHAMPRELADAGKQRRDDAQLIVSCTAGCTSVAGVEVAFVV